MVIDLKKLSSNQIYYTMIQTLIPRPIAWILTDNGNGTYNLAPFSYFNGVASDPPLIFVSIGLKPDKSKKDTWINIEERNEFVIHIPTIEFAKEVSDSSATLPFGESELNLLNHLELQYVDKHISKLPMIKNSKIVYFCEKFQIIEIANIPQGLILGKVRFIYVDDNFVRKIDEHKVEVNPLEIQPLSRLGGTQFGIIREVFNIPRPK